MKHVLGSTLVALVAAPLLTAQSAIAPLATFGANGWLAPGTVPYLTTGNTERGLAYNPTTGNLILVSRAGGINLQVLDGQTGLAVGSLNNTGIAGGTFAANMVGVADDGSIHVCNLSTTATSNFKVYSWPSEAAGAIGPATVTYDALTGLGRTGDSFAVRGGGATAVRFASSGSTPAANLSQNSCFVVGPVDGSNLSTAFTAVPGTSTANNDYRLAMTWIDANTLIGTQGSNARVTSIAGGTAALIDTIPTTAAQRAMDYTVIAGIPCLAILDSNSSIVTIFDVSVPNTPVVLLSATTTTGTLVANVNGTGAVAWGAVNGNSATLYAMNSNQGIQAFAVTVQPPASATVVGVGCGGTPASFYEHFVPSTGFDLSNTALKMINLGGSGYAVQGIGNPYVPPSVGAVSLNLADDGVTTVNLSAPFPHPSGATSALEVCSNGFISVAPGNGTSYQPNPANLRNRAFASFNVWHDWALSPAANVWFEEVAGVAYFTWLNVPSYNGTVVGTVTSTFQMQFDLSTGSVDIVFLGMDNTSVSGWQAGDGYVVGYSPGGGAIDPGSIDLSAALTVPLVLPPADLPNVELGASAAPVLGSSTNLVLDNLPATAPLAVYVFGFTAIPGGLPLPIAPGCAQYVVPLASLFVVTGGAPSFSLPQTYPTDPAYAGLELVAQGVSLTGSGGILASNGLRLYLETF
jgi:hypothetical protein